MKKSRVLMAGLLALLFITGACKTTPTSSGGDLPVPTKPDMAFSTHTGTAYSFEYPSDWTSSAAAGADILYTSADYKTNVNVVTSAGNAFDTALLTESDYNDLFESVSSQFPDLTMTFGTHGKFTQNSDSCIYLNYSSGSFKMTQYVFMHGSDCYILTVTMFADGGNATAEQTAISDYVRYTFKFK